VFSIASKYEVKLLKERTQIVIVDGIDESNAIEDFGFGHQHNSEGIKHAAFEGIKKMFPEAKLPDSLIDKPENLKNLIDIHRKLQKVQNEMKSEMEKFQH
jgi:hypothetical protein